MTWRVLVAASGATAIALAALGLPQAFNAGATAAPSAGVAATRHSGSPAASDRPPSVGASRTVGGLAGTSSSPVPPSGSSTGPVPPSGSRSTVPPAVTLDDSRTGRQLAVPFGVDGIVVVSAAHRVNAAYRPRVTGAHRLAPVAAAAFARMQRTAARAGVRLLVVSGYRSHASQQALRHRYQKLYGAAFTRRYVAVPGTSEHQTGLAVDLRSPSGRGSTFDRTPEWRWLRAHAQAYGFVLRYPRNGRSRTGIGYEPWHWRYIGVDAARRMRASGSNTTLEQFLGLA